MCVALDEVVSLITIVFKDLESCSGLPFLSYILGLGIKEEFRMSELTDSDLS